MSKELKAFERICEGAYYDDIYTKQDLDQDVNSIKQALLEFKRLDLILQLPSEQSSSHFTYKDKNLVCMQLTKYSKLMNAFLEYEKYQEQEKENARLKGQINYLTEVVTEFQKVLKIIKEKCVNIWFLMSSDTVIDYNTRIRELDDSEKFVLTQEEFDLLKRC